jgi:5'-deoxynucleotidase YfbR-like HD superfamily hydrolase
MIEDRFDTSVPVNKDRGPLKQMHSGHMVYILDLRPEDVDPSDIAHHLAIFNRWTGGTRMPMSVAQHSLLVCEEAMAMADHPLTPIYALLHDAAEAYMGDICRPVKAALAQLAPGVLEGIEAGIDAAIFTRFGLPPVMPEAIAALVKLADNIVTSTEGRDMLPQTLPGEPGADWRVYMPEPRRERIEPMYWRVAKQEFRRRLDELLEEVR